LADYFPGMTGPGVQASECELRLMPWHASDVPFEERALAVRPAGADLLHCAGFHPVASNAAKQDARGVARSSVAARYNAFQRLTVERDLLNRSPRRRTSAAAVFHRPEDTVLLTCRRARWTRAEADRRGEHRADNSPYGRETGHMSRARLARSGPRRRLPNGPESDHHLCPPPYNGAMPTA